MPFIVGDENEPFQTWKGGGGTPGGGGVGTDPHGSGLFGGGGSGGFNNPALPTTTLYGRRRIPMPAGWSAPTAPWSGPGGGGDAPVMGAGAGGRTAMPTGTTTGNFWGTVPALQPGGSIRNALPVPGAPTGGFTSDNPWGPFTGDQRGDIWGALNRIIGGFGQGGAFGPGGSSDLWDSIKHGLVTGQGDLERRAQSANAINYGGDPALSGYGSLMGALQGGSDLSRGLASAKTGMLQHQQDFAQQALMQWIQSILQQNLQQNEARLRPRQGGGIGELLGGLAGAGLGAFTGGIGSGIGAGIGRKIGGSIH